jgi:hypothetical protein
MWVLTHNSLDFYFWIFISECFDWKDGIATLSNNTRTYVTYYNDAHDCIFNYTRNGEFGNDTEKICKSCMDKYVTLNTFYESLKGDKSVNTDVCMDIVDSVSKN